MTFLDWSLAYASHGWAVFPLKANSKEPATAHGVKDATRDAEQIRRWWQAMPAANIGVACGAISGIYVIDLDTGNGKDGIRDWEKLGGGLATVRARTGSGGLHLLFKHVDGLGNRKISPSIDSRGDGGYIVAPPSIHASGKRYEWIVGPTEGQALAIPGFLQELPAGNLTARVDLSATPLGESAMSAAERCRLYLQTVPDAISGQGGHAATFRAACECYRFGLTESQAWDLLNWFNQHKCSPPWSEKELRHKLRQGKKKADEEARFGEKINEPEPIRIITLPTRLPGSQHGDALGAMPNLRQDIRFPPRLLDPTGAVGEIVRWINATASKPQPILALGNALSFWGAVVGRLVRTPTDLRSNLYCVGVGESGCGKDHSRKCIKKICEAAGLISELLGGEDVASDAAIMGAMADGFVIKDCGAQKLEGGRSILFQFDEIGHMLSQANSRFAPVHMRAIAPTFTKLFSSASTTLIGKEYGRSVRKDIEQPNACLYGTTVPCRLFEGLTPGDIRDGFLPRMLCFISEDPDPAEVDATLTDPPAAVVAQIQAWHDRRNKPSSKAIQVSNVPIVVTFDADATAAIARYSAECRERKAATRDEAGFDVLWTRAVEHARKMALIVACGIDINQAWPPTVDGSTAQYGIDLSRHLIERFIEAAGDNLAQSEYHRRVQKVQKIIDLARGKGLTMNELSRKTQWLGGRRPRNEILDDLMSGGSIVMVEDRTSTKPAKKIISAKYVIDESSGNLTNLLTQPSVN